MNGRAAEAAGRGALPAGAARRCWLPIGAALLGGALLVVALSSKMGGGARWEAAGTRVEAAASERLPAVGEAGVQFAGCALVRVGPRCEVSAGDVLTLWVAASDDDRVSVALDGLELPPSQREVVEDGTRYRVALPRDTGVLFVRNAAGAEFRLAIAPHVAFEVLAAAERLRHSKDGARAELAESMIDGLLQNSTGEEASRARALLARIQLRKGDTGAAGAALERTLEEALAFGRLSNAFEDAAALAYLRIARENDMAHARAALARVEPYLDQVPQTRAAFEHYTGMAAHYEGQVSVAREHYVRALRSAQRLGHAAKAADVAAPFAELEAELGRYEAAIALVRKALSIGDALPACMRGPLHANLGWLGMLALSQLGPVVDVGSEFERAKQFDATCDDPHYSRHDLINLGLWAIGSGDVARAERWLVELDALHGGQTSELAVWEAELRGAAAAARGRYSEGLAHFDREAALAEARGNWDDQLRAHVARGEMLEKLGQPGPALQAYLRADGAVTSNYGSPLVGLDKDGYFGRRDAAVRYLIDALVRSRQNEHAFAVAVQSFRRSVGRFPLPMRAQRLEGDKRERWERHVSLHRRLRAEIEQLSLTDWQLSREQVEQRKEQRRAKAAEAERELRQALELLEREDLTPPGELWEAPGELLLLLMPGREGWVAFSRFRGVVKARRLEDRPNEVPLAGVRSWLRDFSATVTRAEQLSIMAYGPARSIDFGALELDGLPVVARVPVVYRLGLEIRGREVEATPGSAALIVGDPGKNLHGASVEARDVAARLEAALGQLLIGAQASRLAVLARLAHANFFHYAGHGEPALEEDLAGLPLAADERLTPGDVLALPHAPRHVVLSACDAGRSNGRSLAGGWSMAHAFVMAGSEQVIAPIRPIPDAESARLQMLFYEELAQSSKPSQALARAQARAAAAGVREWSALRTFAP